jgi:hypothetical protein
MKRFLTLCFLTASLHSIAQSTLRFEIVNLGNTYSIEEITSALSYADFCGYFQTNNFAQFTLNDSSVVRLKSKTDLEQLGIFLDPSCLDVKNFQPENEIWSIVNSLLICEKKRLNSKFKNH